MNDFQEYPLATLIKSTRLGGNYNTTLIPNKNPLIKMGNLDRGKIKLNKIEYILSSQFINQEDKLKYGDVLFNTRNTPELVGKIAIWKNELKKAYYNSNLMLLNFDENYISNNFYINYVFNTKEFIDKTNSIAIGTTSVAAIYNRDLMKLTVKIAPLKEQELIANTLLNIENLIDSLEKCIKKREKIKDGILNELFNFSKIKVLYEKRLEDVATIKTGKLDANAATKYGKYRFYTCAKNYSLIDWYAYSGKSLLISGNGEYVGYIHYYDGKFNAYQRTYVLQNFHDENVLFIKYYLDKYLKERINTEKKEGNTPYIVYGTLADLIIKFPEKEYQEQIVNILTNIDEETKLLNKKLNKYKKIKEGMMNDLLTGKVRLNNEWCK